MVTRYYGGTKLGTGGLARAYSEAAGLVLDQSGICVRFVEERFSIEIDFPLYNRLQLMLSKLPAEITDSTFSDRVRLEVACRQSLSDKLQEGFVELTQGKGKIERISTDN